MIIQDNDFLLNEDEIVELAQHLKTARSRLSVLPRQAASSPSSILPDYEKLPGEKRVVLDTIIRGLAYPIRRMRLHYSIADETIARQLVVWPGPSDDVITLARNGDAWRASTNSEFVVRTLIKEVLASGSDLRRDPLCLALSSTSALVFLGILEQLRYERLYSTLLNCSPNGFIKPADVLERMRQSTKEDFRWPLAMFEKVLPVKLMEVVQLEDVSEGLAELMKLELVEVCDDKGLIFELTEAGTVVADGVLHEVSKAALCVSQVRPDGIMGHDAVLLVRSSFYLFLFELAGESAVLATLDAEGVDLFLAKTMEVPDGAIVAAAGLQTEEVQPGELTPARTSELEPTASVAPLVGEVTMPKTGNWVLVVESDPGEARRFPLTGRLTIGRAPENNLVCRDPQASRNHAVVSPDGDGYSVTDLDSNNGTLVNGVRINKSIRLTPGDLLQIGIIHIRILGPTGTTPLHLEQPTLKGTPQSMRKTASLRSAAGSRCPHCGSPIKPSTRFCGVCGKPVNEPPAQMRCLNCGEPVRPGVEFCRECGIKLEDKR